MAEESCAWVHDAVLHERAPFGGEHLPWLAALSGPAAAP